jgi:ATP-dependent DNA ligase
VRHGARKQKHSAAKHQRIAQEIRDKSFNDLRESLAGLPVTNAILDGEIVCLDRVGKSVFKELLFRKGRPRFYAFGLLWLDGEDLRRLSVWWLFRIPFLGG